MRVRSSGFSRKPVIPPKGGTAIGAAGLGAKVALVEHEFMGVDCPNVGCGPSKTLISAARVAATVRDSNEFGVATSVGDRLFYYTDVVIEVIDETGKQFGVRRLVKFLNRFGADAELTAVRQTIVDAVTQHTGGSLDHDVVTFMIVEFATQTDRKLRSRSKYE